MRNLNYSDKNVADRSYLLHLYEMKLGIAEAGNCVPVGFVQDATQNDRVVPFPANQRFLQFKSQAVCCLWILFFLPYTLTKVRSGTLSNQTTSVWF